MEYVTIDFEASCLPRHGRSFPIEVGISGAMGTRSWLIKPDAAWQDWDWTDEAFALHGIERARLDEEGFRPDVVVSQLLRAIGTARVIADSTLDAIWWKTLFAASRPNVQEPDPLHIEHISDIFDEVGATNDQIMFAHRRASTLCPKTHRAAPDARWLWALTAILMRKCVDDRGRRNRALTDIVWNSPARSLALHSVANDDAAKLESMISR